MKHKLLKSSFFILFSVLSLNAQSPYYYYYKGQKNYLELDKSTVNLITNSEFSINETTNIGLKPYTLVQENTIENNQIGKVEYLNEPSLIEFFQKLNFLKSKPNIKSIGLFFKRNEASSIGISNYFYVKLKSVNDLNILQQFCAQKNVQIVKEVPYMESWYIISTTNPQFSSLEISNQFYESSLFADTDPAFMFNYKNNCTNDTNFGSLWGLNNTLNPNIDINACQAWTISQGAGVKVAVVDTGIDMVHNDLQANIYINTSNTSQSSYDCQTYTSPSIVRTNLSNYNHGTHVAGTIGALKDNNLQVVGVAPLSKLMSVSHSLWDTNGTISAELASGISWAYQKGADVINNSWGNQGGQNNMFSVILETAIINAMTFGRNNQGSLVVFSSGNWDYYGMDYPANFNDNILVVSAINSFGQRSYTSSGGVKLDVVAPGQGILSTKYNNQTTTSNGTSMASPHVAGLCALMLSVNPNLSGQQVRDLIEQTCQKVGGYPYATTTGRPNGTWHIEMGYGLIDAYAAVQAATCFTGYDDLMVKDGIDDLGYEPNETTQYMWASSDIWIRKQPDGIVNQEHQNPEYSPTVPNYAYVRVTNKSCGTSSNNAQLKFYWAKAGTSLQWPESWNGQNYFPYPNPSPQQFIKLGNEVATIPIPSLLGGQEIILQIPFMVPNPSDYSFAGSDQWHFCLLARIESPTDLCYETINLYQNVKDNNNIAWKNISIVDAILDRTHSLVAVGNPFNEPRTFLLELVKEDLETGKAIYDEAEIKLKMDQTLFNAWERGGKIAQKIEQTTDEKQKIVKGNNVILDNIAFNAKEMGTLNINFNFLTQELTDKTRFAYHLIQKDKLTGKIIGGETYVINKNIRNAFFADAGTDKEVNKNEPITISASQISEPAIYNWYDIAGNLIFTGKDITIATQVATKYKLEVIATADGFKDYSEVEVNLKPSVLNTIVPNPAINSVTIGYKLNDADTAYLMIIGGYNTAGTSNNYILDVNSIETNIDISLYSNGYYTVALVCNGQIIDAKTLIKH